MSLEIWFKEDIKNIIVGQAQAVGQTPVSPDYWQGYQDALGNLAVALGIGLDLHRPDSPWEVRKPELIEGGRDEPL